MNSDLEITRMVFNFGKVLGICSPWKKNETSAMHVLRQLYTSALILLVVFAVIYSGFEKYYGFWKELPSKSQVILEVMQLEAELCFLLSCLFGSLLKSNNWKNVFSKIKQLDLQLSKENIHIKVNRIPYMTSFLFIHLSYFLLHIYEVISWQGNENKSDEYGYILDRILMYYQFYLTTLIVTMNMTLRRRYWIIQKLVLNIFKKKRKRIIFSHEENEQIISKLSLVKNMYANLYHIISNLNEILGWSIFFIIVFNVLLCLVNVNYVFLFTGSSYSPEFKTSVLITTAIYFIAYVVSIFLTLFLIILLKTL